MVGDALRHLDSNVVADFSRGRYPKVVQRMRQSDRTQLAVSVVAIGELMVGAEKTGDPRIAAEIGTVLDNIRRVAVTEDVARRYAQVRARLEGGGQRMSDNDLWIAATALAEGATLVTADEAFTRISGLRTENWRA